MNDSQSYLIALAGNPNCGKTTLFNAITGARQHVGNYPGITVEKKEGYCNVNGRQLRFVDLPGTYSLTAYSLEELVARNVLVMEKPRVAVNIIDASNLERNLYLTIQLFEMGIPVVIALNMVDVAEGRGIEINADELSRKIGVPVTKMVARSGRGKDELLEETLALAEKNPEWSPLNISYGSDIDPVLTEMESDIIAAKFLTDLYPPRWTALKYLESDEEIIKKGAAADGGLSAKLEKTVARVTDHLRKTLDTYPEAVIADHRYGFISALLKSGVVRRKHETDRLYLSDKIDQFLTHRFLGPVVMCLILYGLYYFAFTYSKIPTDLLKSAIASFSGFVEGSLPPGPLRSLVVSGVINGVGGILGFVPIILFMFLGIAFLEDSGYLARAAFMLDRVFRIFGLHGSSFMAYVVGGGIAGGCGVPGVMATRTLRSPKERIATILTVPFMNCGAKLPVFALLIAAFFAEHEARIMFIITVLSWGTALVISKVLRSTILRGPTSPFLLELPPYRLPTLRGLVIHTTERAWLYLRKAGTTILGISIILWALMNFPQFPNERKEAFEAQRLRIASVLTEEQRAAVLAEAKSGDALPPELAAIRSQILAVDHAEAQATLRYSIAGRIGTGLEHLTQFCGFDWRTNVALLGGFAAKEVIVSTLGTAYSLGRVESEESLTLSEHLARDPSWNPLVGFALIVFCMLYSPCFVAVACIVKEAGSWKWGVFSILFNTAVAFLLAILIYQGGRILGIGV